GTSGIRNGARCRNGAPMAEPGEFSFGGDRRPARGVCAADARGRRAGARPLERSRMRWLRTHHHWDAGTNEASRRGFERGASTTASWKRGAMTAKKSGKAGRGARVRTATIARNTNETRIELELTIEGKGRYKVSTGIRFFDHMLELFTRHGAF